jgi:hypothetical protein
MCVFQNVKFHISYLYSDRDKSDEEALMVEFHNLELLYTSYLLNDRTGSEKVKGKVS